MRAGFKGEGIKILMANCIFGDNSGSTKQRS
jgi:hypothetical protein